MRGFSLVEVLVIAGIMVAMMTFIAPNLTSNQRRTQTTETISQLLSDIREQQLKTMLGDTEGAPVSTSSGVYFESDRYTTFRGLTYSPANPTNFVVALDPQIEFTATSFPGAEIIFSPLSGEVSNFSADNYSVSLSDIQGNTTQTININKYGVVESVN